MTDRQTVLSNDKDMALNKDKAAEFVLWEALANKEQVGQSVTVNQVFKLNRIHMRANSAK